MEALLFYKDQEGKNIPIIQIDGNGYDVVFIKEDIKERILNDFPFAKNNLFALVEGKEFFIKD